MPRAQPTVLERFISAGPAAYDKAAERFPGPVERYDRFQAFNLNDPGFRRSGEAGARSMLGLSSPNEESTWSALGRLDALLSDPVGPLPALAVLASTPIFAPAMARARHCASSTLACASGADLALPAVQRALGLDFEQSRKTLSAMGLNPAQLAAVEVHAFSEAAASICMSAALSASPPEFPVDLNGIRDTTLFNSPFTAQVDWGSDELNFEAIFGVLGRAAYARAFDTEILVAGHAARISAARNPVGDGGHPLTLLASARELSPATFLVLACRWLANVWRYETEAGLDSGRANVLKAACDLTQASTLPTPVPVNPAALDELASYAEGAVLNLSVKKVESTGRIGPRV